MFCAPRISRGSVFHKTTPRYLKKFLNCFTWCTRILLLLDARDITRSIFLHRLKTWASHLRHWSNCIPKYGQSVIWLNRASCCDRLRILSASAILLRLLLDYVSIHIVLRRLTGMLFLWNHFPASRTDSCITLRVSFADLAIVYVTLSSANVLLCAFAICCGKLLMKMRNQNFPSAEPGGTPILVICGEDTSPLRDTNCCRSFK